MLKKAVRQGRSEQRGKAYTLFTRPPIASGKRRFPRLYVVPPSRARTTFGDGRVPARQGWGGEKKGFFSITLLADLPAPEHDKLGAGELFQSHRAPCMDPGSTDPDFGTQTELVAVVEPGRGVD